jgi:hypothetical protein
MDVARWQWPFPFACLAVLASLLLPSMPCPPLPFPFLHRQLLSSYKHRYWHYQIVKMPFNRPHTSLRTIFLLATLLFTASALAAIPAVENTIDNPPPFYPKHINTNKRSALDGRDDTAAMGKCSGCTDKMRVCTAVSIPSQNATSGVGKKKERKGKEGRRRMVMERG